MLEIPYNKYEFFTCILYICSNLIGNYHKGKGMELKIFEEQDRAGGSRVEHDRAGQGVCAGHGRAGQGSVRVK